LPKSGHSEVTISNTPRYILLTHAHWDHVSGVPDFPGVPVLVTASERRFLNNDGFATATARRIDLRRLQEYGFDGARYLGFDQSHDLYGDGSIVIVPAPGHTPGSVVIFVTLPNGARYAFVGDLVWEMEGLLQREERPWLEAQMLGEDPVAVQQSMLRLSAIARRYPDITIVPRTTHEDLKVSQIGRGPLCISANAVGACCITRCFDHLRAETGRANSE
jgi:N-acyl homoserine lactone hydrolase